MKRTGELRHLITIQANADTRDAFGGVTEGWADSFQLWASMEASSGSETLSGEQISGQVAYTFTCRQAQGTITKQMRISYDGRFFLIRSVIEHDERGRWLEIEAVERGL